MIERTPCDHCGMALFPDDAFCPGCGDAIDGAPSPPSPPGRRSARISLAIETDEHAALKCCGKCGGEILPGDAYCQLCGTRQPAT